MLAEYLFAEAHNYAWRLVARKDDQVVGFVGLNDLLEAVDFDFRAASALAFALNSHQNLLGRIRGHPI